VRVLVAAFGDPGHVFPAIALGRALARRGHAVTIETWEERRGAVEGAGLDFTAAEEYRTFPPPEPDTDDGRHAADAARALLPLIERLDPAVVVSDILTVAPTLAAEAAGVPLATLIPHLYPVVESGQPFFAVGLRSPRTPVGRAVWRPAGGAFGVSRCCSLTNPSAGKNVPASSIGIGNWRTSRKVLALSCSDSETSTPNRLWIGAMASGATSPQESSMAPAVAIERYSPSGPQRHAISHSRLRLWMRVGFA